MLRYIFLIKTNRSKHCEKTSIIRKIFSIFFTIKLVKKANKYCDNSPSGLENTLRGVQEKRNCREAWIGALVDLV